MSSSRPGLLRSGRTPRSRFRRTQRVFPRASFSESPFQRRKEASGGTGSCPRLTGIAQAWPLAVKTLNQGCRPRGRCGPCSRRARRKGADAPAAFPGRSLPGWRPALQWPGPWRKARGEPASCFRSVPGETGRLQAGQDAETRSRSRRASRHPDGQAPGVLPASALSRPAPRQPWPTACQGIRQSRF